MMKSSSTCPSLGYNSSLDGVRAVSIILVMLAHANFQLGMNGGLGVAVFFTLSGFLITTLLLEEQRAYGHIGLPAFYIRRTMRLFPALYTLLIVLLVYALLSKEYDVRNNLLGEIRSAALYVYNISWAWGWQFKQLFLYHTWSLGVEEQFYLFWPFLLILVLRWGSVALTARILVACIVLLWGLNMCSLLPLQLGAVIKESIFIGCAGALIRWQRNGNLQLPSWLPLLMLGLIVAVGVLPLKSLRSWPPYQIFNVVSIASMILIWGIVTASSGILHRLLANPVLVFIGKISYALYLWHLPVFKWFYLHSPFTPMVSFVAKFAVTFLLSFLSWWFIENKARKWGRVLSERWMKKREG